MKFEMEKIKQEFVRYFGTAGERVLVQCAGKYVQPTAVSVADLAASIDHTLLNADATAAQVERLCAEAVQWSVATVCVNSVFAPLARDCLQNSAVGVCCVVGFPLGATATEAKAYETKWSVDHGADEIDMVISIGALKAGDLNSVVRDIQAVRAAMGTRTLKVILETALLTQREKVLGAWSCVLAGTDFVKTSTGFASSGATVADVELLRNVVGTAAHIKAAGGIRTLDQALTFMEASADRLGTSRTGTILAKR